MDDKTRMIPSNYRTPVIFEAGKYGEQAWDVFSWLAQKHNKIYIDSVINDEMANMVSGQLFAFSYKGTSEVELVINSPGGSVVSLFTILDCIDLIRKGKANMTIKTSCVGMAASAAAVLLAYGDKGHRLASKRSTIMLHDMSYGIGGTHKDVECQRKLSLRLREEIKDVLLNKTNITKERLEPEFMDRDNYLDPFEAKQYGIIDGIKESF
jgi:ATP-dependent Clp protease, protease subunit